MSGFSYKNFCPPWKVDGFLYCNRVSMILGAAGREVAANLVGGVIGDGNRSAKQFVRTRRGLFRLSTRDNADNSTETAAHIAMGVTGTVYMGDWDDSMKPWLKAHGVDITYQDWYDAVDRELKSRL